MTEIEQKALALLNEVQADWNYQLGSLMFKRDRDVFSEALCRAIEQHEATKQELSDYKQKVSDVATVCTQHFCKKSWTVGDRQDHIDMLTQFIIPAPKPDPLAEVLRSFGGIDADICDFNEYAEEIRAALDELGLEIREKNDD